MVAYVGISVQNFVKICLVVELNHTDRHGQPYMPLFHVHHEKL